MIKGILNLNEETHAMWNDMIRYIKKIAKASLEESRGKRQSSK